MVTWTPLGAATEVITATYCQHTAASRVVLGVGHPSHAYNAEGEDAGVWKGPFEHIVLAVPPLILQYNPKRYVIGIAGGPTQPGGYESADLAQAAASELANQARAIVGIYELFGMTHGADLVRSVRAVAPAPLPAAEPRRMTPDELHQCGYYVYPRVYAGAIYWAVVDRGGRLVEVDKHAIDFIGFNTHEEACMVATRHSQSKGGSWW